MTMRELTYYQVMCDEPGCRFVGGGAYSAWAEAEYAEDEWRDNDGQILASDPAHFRYYCEEHWRPVCAKCGVAAAALELDEPEGDPYCPRHLAAARANPT